MFPQHITKLRLCILKDDSNAATYPLIKRLSHFEMTSITESVVNKVHFPSLMEDLTIQNANLYKDVCKLLCSKLAYVPTLKTLSFSGSVFSDDGLSAFTLPNTVTQLFFTACTIFPSGLCKLMPQLSTAQSLHTLELQHNFIDDVQCMASGLPPTLKRLDLSANRLTDTGVMHLGRQSHLQILLLGGNKLTDKCVQFMDLPSSLRYLGLQQNRIGDKQLSEWLLPPRLMILNLNMNNISWRGLSTLRLPPLLQTLGLHDNNWSVKDEHAILQIRLPPQLPRNTITKHCKDSTQVVDYIMRPRLDYWPVYIHFAKPFWKLICLGLYHNNISNDPKGIWNFLQQNTNLRFTVLKFINFFPIIKTSSHKRKRVDLV